MVKFPMKTTIDVRDDLYRRAKAAAAMRGETVKDFITSAIADRLEREAAQQASGRGWRRAFGRATPEQVSEVDAIAAREFEEVDPEEWR